MTHKILIQLEEDIQAQADMNLERADTTGKPLIAPNAIIEYEAMIEKFLSLNLSNSQEQSVVLENEQVNIRKDS